MITARALLATMILINTSGLAAAAAGRSFTGFDVEYSCSAPDGNFLRQFCEPYLMGVLDTLEYLDRGDLFKFAACLPPDFKLEDLRVLVVEFMASADPAVDGYEGAHVVYKSMANAFPCEE